MRKTLRAGLIAGISLFLIAGYVFSQDGKHAYVGSKQCMPCHMAPAKGAQFKKWQDGPHSKAYETLASDYSKEVAKEAGVSGDPQEAAECLTCHVTGYEAPKELKTMKYTMEEGVGCESCHGPGGDYWKMNIMKGIDEGKLDGAEYGLIEPDEENCTQCHNEKSPTFDGFNYEEAYKQIAHPNPQNEG